MNWWQTDILIMASYGFVHSCLTTRPAMKLYEVFFPEWSWNIGMCVFSAATLALGIFYWSALRALHLRVDTRQPAISLCSIIDGDSIGSYHLLLSLYLVRFGSGSALTN